MAQPKQLVLEAFEIVWCSLKRQLENEANDTVLGWQRRELLTGRGNEGLLSFEAIRLLRHEVVMVENRPELRSIRDRLLRFDPFTHWQAKCDYPLGRVVRDLSVALARLAIDGILRTGNIAAARSTAEELYQYAAARVQEPNARYSAFARLDDLSMAPAARGRIGEVDVRRLTNYEVNRLGFTDYHRKAWVGIHEIQRTYLIYDFLVPRDKGSERGQQFDIMEVQKKRTAAITQAAIALGLACEHDLRYQSIELMAEFPFDETFSHWSFYPVPTHPIPEVGIAPLGWVSAARYQPLLQSMLASAPDLVDAIDRYLKSLFADDPRQGVADGVIAIEGLLFGGDGAQSKTHKFASRLAAILASSPEERTDLTNEGRALYDARSKIVHARPSRLPPLTQWDDHVARRQRTAALFRGVLQRLLLALPIADWKAFWQQLAA